MEKIANKQIRLISCLICPTKEQHGMFKLPSNQFIRQQWLSAIHRNEVKPNAKICYKHFESTCFVQKDDVNVSNNKLHAGSIPTLNLPISEDSANVSHMHKDHNYAQNFAHLSKKYKNPETVTTKKVDSDCKRLREQLCDAEKTINSLVNENERLKKLMSSKDFKEAICYEMLHGKFSLGQLDFIIKVSALWGFLQRLLISIFIEVAINHSKVHSLFLYVFV